jgi:hypothetical protein
VLQSFGLMAAPQITGETAASALQPASGALGSLNGSARSLVAS